MATLAAPELDVRPKKPNKLIDNSHPKKEGVKMNLNYNKVMPFLVVMISLINYNVYAGNVTGKNIWLNRYNDETLSEISSGFYADVWGTINEFSSIVLTSPLNNTYNLSLSIEGDQWGFDYDGITQNEIDLLFPDGSYRFDVTYTDTITETFYIELDGNSPPYPSNVTVSGNTITWNVWNSPQCNHYEVVVYDVSETDFFEDYPVCGTSSVILPENFFKDNITYNIEIWFVYANSEGGRKSNVTLRSYLKGDINKDGNLDLQDALIGLITIVGDNTSNTINLEADINNNGKIGMEEIVYLLRIISDQ